MCVPDISTPQIVIKCRIYPILCSFTLITQKYSLCTKKSEKNVTFFENRGISMCKQVANKEN